MNTYSKNIVRWLAVIWLGLTANLTNAAPSLTINYDPNETIVKYGEHTEIEFEVQGASETDTVWFEIEDDELPPGMTDEDYANQVVLTGFPRFTGRWCFELRARTQTAQVAQEICLDLHWFGK